MFIILILSFLLGVSTPAYAAGPDETARAEYVRLSAELKRLAEKNAWAGVERTYQAILETGVDPSYDDYFYAAHAARSFGDVTAARDRLLLANNIREEREVMDWLWEIDSSYGKVSLMCDPGTLELTPDSMPFHPDRAAAVQFAQTKIKETGTYEGYLPEGNYTFGHFDVRVVPRVTTVRIDARGAQDEQVARRERRGRRGRTEEAEPAVAAATPEPEVEPDVVVVEEHQPEPEVVEPEPAVAEVEPEVVQPEPEVVQPEPWVVEPEPEVVQPEPEVVQPEPEVVEPEPAVVEAEPETEAEAEPLEPEPMELLPRPENEEAVAEVEPIEPAEIVPTPPKPKPEREPGKSPYLINVLVGSGNNYGGIVGAGVQVVARPGSGMFALSGGIGYDFPYTAVGLSLAARVYPHEYVYFGTGIAPLIWYAGQLHAPDGAVAHGPHLFAGLDIPLGPIRLDGYIGAGAAPAVDKIRPAMSGGVGIGASFL